MTTATATDIKYARYSGNLLGSGPFSWGQAQGIERGIIFAVDADGLPKLQSFLNGDDRQRASFAVMDAAYVESLRRCVGCHVYFATELQEQRHVAFHQERGRNTPELARLQELGRLDAEDKQAIHEAELRIVERAGERDQLQQVVTGMGLEPAIVAASIALS